jgi:hypothetical protein
MYPIMPIYAMHGLKGSEYLIALVGNIWMIEKTKENNNIQKQNRQT